MINGQSNDIKCQNAVILNEFSDLRREKAAIFDEYDDLRCKTIMILFKYCYHEKQNEVNPEKLGDIDSLCTVNSYEFDNLEIL